MKPLRIHLRHITILGWIVRIELTHIGITTRGLNHLAIPTIKPYRNTLRVDQTLQDLHLSTLTGRAAPSVMAFYCLECVFIWQTHCGQDSNLHGGLAELPPDTTLACLPISSPRVPEVNYSPAWMLPADSIYHIETHYTSTANMPYTNISTITFDYLSRIFTFSGNNVFLYGGPTGIRTLTLTG